MKFWLLLTIVFVGLGPRVVQAASPLEFSYLGHTKDAAPLLVWELKLTPAFVGKINALDGWIKFDRTELRLERVDSAPSAIELWARLPAAAAKGSAQFLGISPGGVNPDASVLRFYFSRLQEGNSPVVTVNNLELGIQKSPGDVLVVSSLSAAATSPERIATHTPAPLPVPADLRVEIVRHPAVLDGKWFVGFGATNQQTSIAEFQMQESYGWYPTAKKWRTVTSPATLENQSGYKFVYVKARGSDGSEQVVRVWPEKLRQLVVGATVGALILLICGIIVSSLRRAKRSYV